MLEHRVSLSERPPASRPGPARLSVLVADDHPGVVGHLRGLLTAAAGMTVVAEAADGREAISLALRHNPDVLVLDLRMSGGDGVEAIRAVRRALPGTAVLVFTACEDDESVLTAMRAGARGYLLKCASDEDIVRAVRGVAAGEAIFGQNVAARVLDLLARPRDTRPLPSLTMRERQLLDLLAAGHGNAAIAARLRLAPKTVSNLVSALQTKLGVTDRKAAISRMRTVGDCR
ncbi:MAG TPA: response regulator transcription factor [Actinophytocola sp.]|uniref:response regulator transcription factor n=1 Tax=Actinophytocola sp. TaxID=1872138 RepID=UPI002DDD53CF|nr:response regulator transcription factor [Actinophytocola sp.]HEV2783449.1 response regulator transcription factor [Actinophytocola sp.]